MHRLSVSAARPSVNSAVVVTNAQRALAVTEAFIVPRPAPGPARMRPATRILGGVF